IDAYRLLDSDLSNFADLDFESYLASSVFVIEWGKDFVSTLTDQYLEVNIVRGQNEDQRQVEFVMVGNRWENFKL
ncbi:MAG: tRNA (adenosine(37)-N6)-threonylcarbamoyltransferase complex ATPase subunit type 1 TsaE, partial [Actinobacteria bacterium]|nr:tRNA (adenosine(37)-N6)-threonylcarbamoyltransferase complex ATPase subunit type 1 TsaE [Actinomycetota bacterium]